MNVEQHQWSGWAYLLHEGHEAMPVRGVQHVGRVEQREVRRALRDGALAVPRAVPAPAHQRRRQERRLQRHLQHTG